MDRSKEILIESNDFCVLCDHNTSNTVYEQLFRERIVVRILFEKTKQNPNPYL